MQCNFVERHQHFQENRYTLLHGRRVDGSNRFHQNVIIYVKKLHSITSQKTIILTVMPMVNKAGTNLIK